MNICPNPGRWHEIYERLLSACAERNLTKPPLPLILNGWVGTNDVEKAERWAETVDWAERHGLADLVTVQPQDWYTVEKPSSYFIANSLAGRPNVEPRTSRDIRARALAEEEARSPHKILRTEFYVECSCGYRGPALNNACRKCGAQINMLAELLQGSLNPFWS